MTRTPFGHMPDGRQVERVAISGGGLEASFLTFGAVLQNMTLEGRDAPLVLGLNTIDDYIHHSASFGITAGRCANRIARARFALDGQTYQLEPNNTNGYQVHGGADGLGKRLWQVESATESRVTLRETLPDGHMGYPGQLTVWAEFSLPGDGVFDIKYRAETDAPTLCNIAHHSYWNLTGGPDLSGHRMQVDADRMTEVDDILIPTGRSPEVSATAYDFRKGVDLGAWPQDLLLDHNFCISGAHEPIRRIATLSTDDLAMDIRSTEPGLQVYDGALMNVAVPGLGGRRYGARAGIALEPQIWPDAINHDDFPSPILRPGETYLQHTQFAFRKA